MLALAFGGMAPWESSHRLSHDERLSSSLVVRSS